MFICYDNPPVYLIHVSILCTSILLDAKKPHEYNPDTATLYVSGGPRCQLPLYPNGLSQRYFVLLAGSRIHSVRITATFRDRPFPNPLWKRDWVHEHLSSIYDMFKSGMGNALN